MSNKNKSNNKNNSNSIVKMIGGAGVRPIPPPQNFRSYNELNPPDDILKQDLFQIINKKINNIVEDLKKRLGPDIQVSNENAKDIMKMLNTFNLNINTIIDRDIRLVDQNIVITGLDGKRITQKTANYYTKINLHPDQIKNNLENMETIDTPNAVKYANVDDNQALDLSTSADLNKLNDRLRNCQNLEILYLIKHDELMTTFAFTLNLFDKYKYAVKIILLLLKSLVYKKETTGGPTGKVQLPGEIIKKIGVLVKDQQVVQGVINEMKKTLIEDPDNPINLQDPNIEEFVRNAGNLQHLTKRESPPLPQENNLNRTININTIPA